MPFPEATRDWVKRAQGDQCLALHYSEAAGFVQCQNPIDQIHHLEPEGWVLAGNEEFDDPNQSTPAGLCMEDHQAKHPDLVEAKKQYREGNYNSFAEMAHNHHEMAQQGIVYWNNETDQSMIDHAHEVHQRYAIEHPEDKKPQVPEHKKTVHRSWTDIYFGKRSHPEDEGS